MNQTFGRGTILISYFTLAVGAITALFPLSLMVLSALKTSAEIVANPLSLSSALHWINFSRAWTDAQLGRSLLNSMETTGLAIVLICSTSSMAAYALARKTTRGSRWISAYVLATTDPALSFPALFRLCAFWADRHCLCPVLRLCQRLTRLILIQTKKGRNYVHSHRLPRTRLCWCARQNHWRLFGATF